MKIICTTCNEVLGEQTPFDSSSKIYAKCTDCINKQKEETSKFKPKPKPGEEQEITLENGLKGVLWVSASEKEKLSFGELSVSGKKFYCIKDKLEEFQRYLKMIKNEAVKVSFLHSITCKIDSPPRDRRKKQEPPKAEESKKDESVQYNCTIRAPKHYIQLMYDDMAERMDNIAELLAEATLKAYQEEQQKAVQDSDKVIK